MSRPATSDEALGKLQRDTFGYFLKETNLQNGFVPDNTRRDARCSIAAVGLGLAAYTVGSGNKKGWHSILRTRPGADHFDDRELPLRLPLAADTGVPVHRDGPAPRGVQGPLVRSRE